MAPSDPSSHPRLAVLLPPGRADPEAAPCRVDPVDRVTRDGLDAATRRRRRPLAGWVLTTIDRAFLPAGGAASTSPNTSTPTPTVDAAASATTIRPPRLRTRSRAQPCCPTGRH